MNVLIVDDQREIVESLKNDINWKDIPAEKIHTAVSAKEAKMIIRNFDVDVLLTDIEMPEEDGLSLFKWTRENYPNVVGVFLTSHADFDYAQNAIHIGGFDYILQPARYEDIESSMKKVYEKIKTQERVKQLESSREIVQEQRNQILGGLLHQVSLSKKNSANQLYKNFPEVFQLEPDNSTVTISIVKIQRWETLSNKWNEKLLRLVFCNVIEELFDIADGKVAVSSFSENMYLVLLVTEKNVVSEEFYKKQMEAFCKFVNDNMEFKIGVYPSSENIEEDFSEIYEKLLKKAKKSKKYGLFLDDEKLPEEVEDDPISVAQKYIKDNIEKTITRNEVAEIVHLNEEYFSRLFRQQTGLTFKDYVQYEKIEEAKSLLKHSSLSISIVASKVGYDNLSHFSKMFKKLTSKTPQEYRKDMQQR